MAGASETRGRVNDNNNGSRNSPDKAGDGIHVPGPLHRHPLASRGVSPHPQRRGRGCGRTDRRGLRREPGGQPPVAAGPSQVRHIPSASGATSPHPQGRVSPPRPDPWGFRPLKTKCFRGRWSWFWKPSTNRTSWTARTVSALAARRTKRWTRCGRQTMTMGGGWILDVDIRKFFDTIDHGHLRDFSQASDTRWGACSD